VNEYQAVLKDFLAKTKGEHDSILTGHNAGPVGPKYLEYMVLAAQKVIDRGDAALVPSVRPADINSAAPAMVWHLPGSNPAVPESLRSAVASTGSGNVQNLSFERTPSG
jgi:hypothetical protein